MALDPQFHLKPCPLPPIPTYTSSCACSRPRQRCSLAHCIGRRSAATDAQKAASHGTTIQRHSGSRRSGTSAAVYIMSITRLSLTLGYYSGLTPQLLLVKTRTGTFNMHFMFAISRLTAFVPRRGKEVFGGVGGDSGFLKIGTMQTKTSTCIIC